MDWANPYILFLLPWLLLVLLWARVQSQHPMSPARQRALLIVRGVAVALAVLALAGPAMRVQRSEHAVMFVVDQSESLGERGRAAARQRAQQLARSLPDDTHVGFVTAGVEPEVRGLPRPGRTTMTARDANRSPAMQSDGGAQTDLASAVRLARGLFPAGTSRRIVMVTDGVETRGSVRTAAREAAAAGVTIDALPIAAAARPDVRVRQVRPSRSRLHEGASLEVQCEIEASLSGSGRVRLFENGIEVASESLTVEAGTPRRVTFNRTPTQRDLYRYRVRVDGFADDTIESNNAAMTLVDVQGRPRLLYIEGEPSEAHYLVDAMAREGIELEARPARGLPTSLQNLAGYDGVILSDVPAHKLSAKQMALLRDYVDQLGGGLIMIGGPNAFGVGGYYRTPIEEVLPVKIKSPDTEQRHSVALVLVIDRSGSMSGQKLEICKSAAADTVDLLSGKDYVGVVAFDSSAHWVAPMRRVGEGSELRAQIASLSSGGGTNVRPGMEAARQAINNVKARVKHMIVLTDGHTTGENYETLARRINEQKVTISTVGVGGGADHHLLKAIASAGAGKYYRTDNPSAIPHIFTQDTMTHVKRLVREQTFKPRQSERHPMLGNWSSGRVPPMLGYVRTHPRATAQVPLVTDLADPLLAHWRYGLGKVTAFTSDCKSRWAALWLTQWRDGYSRFWSQVIRETARPPQGRTMDLRLTEENDRVRIEADVMADAATFKQGAQVEAQVYFAAAGALGSGLTQLKHTSLEQSGPGRYKGAFRPDEPGVYLVRARSGAEMVSAGLVRNVSGETATGRIDRALLERVAQITEGRLLSESVGAIELAGEAAARLISLRPALLITLLLLFMGDLALRRWENVLGMGEIARSGVDRLLRRG